MTGDGEQEGQVKTVTRTENIRDFKQDTKYLLSPKSFP